MRAFVVILLLTTSAHGEVLRCERSDTQMTSHLEIDERIFDKLLLTMRFSSTINVEYVVTEATTTHYSGHQKLDFNTKLNLDRTTGRLVIASYAQKTSLPSLVALCDKKMTLEQCVSSLPGDEGFHCLASVPEQNQCERWRAGNALVSQMEFSCKPATR